MAGRVKLRYPPEMSGDQQLQNTTNTTLLHVVLFAFPLKGHINPALNLAQRLQSQGASITFLSAQYLISPLKIKYSNQLSSKFQLVGFSEEEPRPPNFDPDSVAGIGWAFNSTDRMRDSLTELIARLKSASKTPLCIVSDYFLGWTQDVAEQFHLPWYAFHPSSASHLALLFYTPVILSKHLHISSSQLHDDERTHFIDAEPFYVPGIGCLQVDDLPDHFRNGFPMLYHRLQINIAMRLHKAAGVLLNTFEELEKSSLQALRTNFDLNPNAVSIFPIGPCLPTSDQTPESKSSSTLEVQEALIWLNDQAISSVLYICFGSLFKIDDRQIQELALGLEASGQPFFWVFKLPCELEKQDVSEILPAGFLSRTRRQGKLFTGWAPQLQILSHFSIGGFLSHCGWNSTMESIVMKVPILAFPQHADQMLNARLITEELRTALMLAKGSNKLVDRHLIARAVRSFMRNTECRKRAREIRNAARSAMSEGGDSLKSLSLFIESATYNYVPTR